MEAITRLKTAIEKFKTNNIKCTLCVDSNIGGGKSTLLELINNIPELKEHIELLLEPVEQWQNIDGRYNLLDLFYKDQQKYSYIFQTMTVITRMEMHDKADKQKLIIGERSWLTDKNVFVKQLHADGVLNDFEYACYNEWFDYWSKKSQIDGIIYIDTNPEECYRRKHMLRCREEEESIPIEYLINLDKRHKEWLDINSDLMVEKINGDVNFIEEKEEFYKIIDQITNLVTNIFEKKND